MKKPVKPVKKRAPQEREKPIEYVDKKDYSFRLENYESFILSDFLESRGINIESVSVNDIFINIDIDTDLNSWSGCDNNSYIDVSVVERHRNPNYDNELKLWESYQKKVAEHNKLLSKYNKDLEKYNKNYPKWLKYEADRVEKEQIEQAKELLKSKGIKV